MNKLTKDEIILLAHKKIQSLNKILDDFSNQPEIHHTEYNELFDRVKDLIFFIEESNFYKSNIPND